MAKDENNDAEQALHLLQTALALLDKSGAAHDAAAHLDLVIHRLAERIAATPR